MKNYIEISSQAISNDLALKEIEAVLSFTKDEHGKFLNDIKEKNKIQIIDDTVKDSYKLGVENAKLYMEGVKK